MITVHHLNTSRSHRILWLLEEIGQPYEIKRYERDPQTRFAPPELKTAHPLGKSPVITDGKRTIAESGAIIEYLIYKYAPDRLAPKQGSSQWIDYIQWLHFAEGSAMLPMLLALYVGRLGEAGAPLQPRIDSEIKNNLGYIESELKGGHPFICGKSFTGADIQIGFVLDAAGARGRLADFPECQRYLAGMQARPAYKRAIERGGPVI
jgi:glutathione S-transferase